MTDRSLPGAGLLAGLFVLLASCESVHALRDGDVSGRGPFDVVNGLEGLAATRVSAAASFADLAGGEAPEMPQEVRAREPGKRLIIYTGKLRLGVGNLEDAAREGVRLAKELGGYAQEITSSSVVLRVPAPRWDEALEKAAKLGRVLDRQIRAQDVTEEIVDVRLRLQNALALRKRLEELLARTTSVEEILKVEKELSRVRTEVEQLEGKLQSLENDVAFSTLTLAFVQVAEVERTVNLPFSWLESLGVERLLAAGRRRS